jgi:signal transduction histidine kinase/CheY-like chemotaxis protein
MKKHFSISYQRIACLFILLSLVLCLSAAAFVPHNRDDGYVYSDYRDIPGVTPEEITAVEAIKEKYDSLSYGVMETMEAFYQEDGTVDGYAAYVASWLTDLFDIPFVTQIYDWDALMEALDSGEVAFSGELTATPQRRERYDMTDSFTIRSLMTFRLRNSETISDIAKKRPVRFAFLKDTTSITAATAVLDYAYEYIELPNIESVRNALFEGSIDAFISEEHGLSYFPKDIIGETLLPIVYSPISLSTANAELKPIISVINKYLHNGALVQLAQMYKDGREKYFQYRIKLDLTEDEIAYMNAHQKGAENPIPYLAETDNYPNCFYNETDQEFQGIAIDVLRDIENMTNMEFTIVNTAEDRWPDLYAKLLAGEGAMVTELIATDERSGKFLWTEEPYSVDNYVLISTAKHENITINQILYENIGVGKGTAYESLLREWFPEQDNFTIMNSTSDGYPLMEDGTIDLMLASKNLLLQATNYLEMPGFKANLVFKREFGSYFGFHRSETTLSSIVSKAQRYVDTDTIVDEWRGKVYDYRGELARQRIPYLLMLSVLLSCVILLLIILILRARNARLRLRVQTEAAQVASAAKGNFLSRMSHEMRTPLNAVMGMGQVAKRYLSMHDTQKAGEAINEMLSASSHLLDVINDVLDISKIEAGKLILTHAPFSLNHCLHEVESMIMQRCTDKAITFTTNSQELPPYTILGDSLRLKQVLINLLGNALKFTSSGEISLTITHMGESESDVTIRFSVTDTGIGMSMEQQSKLFVAFEQADNTVFARFGGTGLGLAISQNLVRHMGGEITVSSESGKGSVFSFTLCFAKSDYTSLRGEETPSQLPDFSGKNILLAEDIEINRDIVTELLEDTNANFAEACDGVEAVRMFQNSAEGYFDVILMDIQMPEMDGYEATKQIRRLPRRDAASVPIIAMTANAYREDIEKALNSGMNGHLSKPVNFKLMVATLQSIFKQ